MQIYIVRHGTAIDRDDPKCPSEAERYLTEEGIEKTKQVARGFAALGVEPEVMISSPYVRALQTAELFAAALGYPKQKIRQTELLLPEGDPPAFFRELAKEKDAAVVCCFGHGPNVDELIAAGTGNKHSFTTLKKAGVALLELNRISPPSGQLLWLVPPKLLKRAGK